MFTGLIEEIGAIRAVQSIAGGRRFKIEAKKILDDLKSDDSVAVNGVCLTVTALDSDGFRADAVGATLEKTTLSKLKVGKAVNLERALRLQDRLGGHLVQGHINGLALISQIRKLGENYDLEVEVGPELLKYIVAEGSIALDGISLTVARLAGSRVGVSVIPYTWAHTTLKLCRPGDPMNVEIDILAKYVEKLLMPDKENPGENNSGDEWFKKLGY